ncbi:MAG: adenylosuccinate synthase [Acholeplasmataceae bacterium]|nr:adenylosuccinate synthase [Acholeplasmataceae bacterium]
MKRLVVVGTQWGDEGKGKITDYLAQKADVVCRFQGGDNAGHTIVLYGDKHSLHLLPSGALNDNIINVMANGMVINPETLVHEIETFKPKHLLISDRAHVIFPFHRAFDIHAEALKEGALIGTTQRGIGPAYADKASRIGMRMATFVQRDAFLKQLDVMLRIKNDEASRYGLDPFDKETIIETYGRYAEQIKTYVTDTSSHLNHYIHTGKNIVFEGAQGSLLCLDHGTYPYVTSSSPTAASVPLNTGIAPWLIDGAIGVTKAYTTRVGQGPLPSEIDGVIAHQIREKGHEYGTTTGRPRRIGWLDTVVIRHAKQTGGLTGLAVTLLDVLTGIDPLYIVDKYILDGVETESIPASIEDFNRVSVHLLKMKGWTEKISDIKSYDDLPIHAKSYLQTIERLTGLPIMIYSVGPDRHQTIERIPIFLTQE